MDNLVPRQLYRQDSLPGHRTAQRSFSTISNLLQAKPLVPMVLALVCFVSGCAGLSLQAIQALLR